MECLENIKRTGEKSIIFSQWTGFLDLLEIALRDEFGFLRFDGKLNQQRREYILKEFNESKDKTVSPALIAKLLQFVKRKTLITVPVYNPGATHVTQSRRCRLESHSSI